MSTRARAAQISIIIVSTILAWLSGYDFNHRGLGVAIWAGITFFAMLAITLAEELK